MLAAILQARTGSTRLPNKVLKKIYGKTLLELFVNRIRSSSLIEKIIIATTSNADDNVIEELAQEIGVDCFRGNENDLLDRYYCCAKQFNVDPILRITPDDPFVDYQIIEKGVKIYRNTTVNFVTNHFEPTYPEGLDIEIYSFETLEKCWKRAKLASEREHVFLYIQNHPEEFKIVNFGQERNYSHLRWTIDYQCDFEMTKAIYRHLYVQNHVFLQDDILKLLRKYPEIAELNSHIGRKEGINKSKSLDQFQI